MSNDLDLKGTGFVEASGEVRPRIIMSIEGLEGDGKTHLACTAPGPIGFIDFDVGTEGVVEKFKKGLNGCTKKDIYISSFRIPVTAKAAKYASKETKARFTSIAAEKAEPIWEKVVRDYVMALERFRTLIIDTGTEMHEMIRLARLGKLTEVLPENYAPVNAEFRDLVRLAFDSDCNVIFLHKMKDEWIKAKGEKRSSPTGNQIRQGFNGMGYLPQVNLRARWDEDDGFTVEVLKCRQNADMRGKVFGKPYNTFPYLAAMIFPNSELEDWE